MQLTSNIINLVEDINEIAIAKDGTASATSELQVHTADRAYNDDFVSLGWGNNNEMPVEIEYEFPVAQKVNEYSFFRSSVQTSGWGGVVYAPADWKTYGQIEGSAIWIELDNIINKELIRDSLENIFRINSEKIAYKKIKHVITRGRNSDWVSITEITYKHFEGKSNFVSLDETLDLTLE